MQEFVDVMDYAVGLSRSFGGTVVQSEREKHFITEVANPLGVVGVISAFNFPNAVFGWNMSLAFITGNATVWKPAPTTPLTAIATTKILQSVLEANKLPAALAALVCGGGEAGDALVSDKRVDLLSFTGSEARGRDVSMKVASRFGQSLLELGGNNSAIVLPDANLPLALQAITFAALGTAGQRCTTTRRVFLHESIAPHFITSLVEAYKSVSPSRIGDPLESGTLVGPLHTQDAVKRFHDAVKQAKEQGGEVLVGGDVVKMDGELAGGNWVQPTIVLVRDVDNFPIMKQETFAPILYVSTVGSLEEAIQRNNEVEQGLSTALFTKDLGAAMQVIGPAGADSGIINVNSSTSGAEIGARFGGNKSTGWVRRTFLFPSRPPTLSHLPFLPPLSRARSRPPSSLSKLTLCTTCRAVRAAATRGSSTFAGRHARSTGATSSASRRASSSSSRAQCKADRSSSLSVGLVESSYRERKRRRSPSRPSGR